MVAIHYNVPATVSPVRFLGSSPFLHNSQQLSLSLYHGIVITNTERELFLGRKTCGKDGKDRLVCRAGGLLPVDPWAPTIDSENIASQLFAVSLFPYIGFLYFITKSKSAPKLTLFGFYFLLAFVGATTLLGTFSNYCKRIVTIMATDSIFLSNVAFTVAAQYLLGFTVNYGTSLSNVDWLHGGAESLLTLTNLFIVLGLRQALRKSENAKQTEPNNGATKIQEQEKSSV